jgi:bacillolysin
MLLDENQSSLLSTFHLKLVAINEAMSDIVGAGVEEHKGATQQDIWKIGEDIYMTDTPGDALRYMNNPTEDRSSKDWYPTRYMGTLDNGGVHWNSGIANLAFYLLSEGGWHPRATQVGSMVKVQGIGIDHAADIFYYANTECLTPAATFVSARYCTAEAAVSLFNDYESNVHAAWDAVGVPSF